MEKDPRTENNYLDFVPVIKPRALLSNIKNNLLFLISMVSFLCLFIKPDIVYLVSVGVAVVIQIVFISQCSSVSSFCRSAGWVAKVLSAFSALGMCWCNEFFSAVIFGKMINRRIVYSVCSIRFSLQEVIATVLAVLALYFVYVCILYVWNQIFTVSKRSMLFKGVKWYEIIVYSMIFVSLIFLTVHAFTSSQAFWGYGNFCDIIYTGDSPYLARKMAYLNVFHPENDFRQPLFALFSAPFMGMPYLVSRLFGASFCTEGIIMNVFQNILLLFSFFVLTKTMDLSPMKRVCFILVVYSSYMALLFSLMMEQYIVAFFWLIWTIYVYCVDGKTCRLAVYGATGTLTTSAALFLLRIINVRFSNFKKWIIIFILEVVGFLLFLIAFCRLDILITLARVKQLMRYAGVNHPLGYKILQYITNASNCFMAPNTRIDYSIPGHNSWQLAEPVQFSVVGIAVIAVAVVGYIVNHRKRICNIAWYWLLFSVLILVIIGWGTMENSLILYSLYFGWPFFVLVFCLFEKFEEKLKTSFLIPVISVLAVIFLLSVNIPAIFEMIQFAVKYYPM